MVMWVAPGWPAQGQFTDTVAPVPPQLLVTKHSMEAEGFLGVGKLNVNGKGKL